MHRYLRAIGFSKLKDHGDMHKVIMDVVANATKRSYTSNSDKTMLAEFSKDFAENLGIAVCGEFDDEDKFTYEYCYPYLRGTGITSEEDISVERHTDKESYAGVCDDIRVGVSLVFYLQNMINYAKIKYSEMLPIKGTTLTLSGLSISGNIVLPLNKDEADIERSVKDTQKRTKLISQARQGNEEAIETLTLEDMDTYNAIAKKVKKIDLLTLIDTYFMPYGVECDQYSILGEIKESRLIENQLTGEEVYIMKLLCNELSFDICINKKDLYGQPLPGRRFKGTIWMQGNINFPEIYGVS